MKQFLKSSVFITLPLLYLAYYVTYFSVFDTLKSNFLHYSKMNIMYNIIFVSQCLIILCCFFLLLRLFVNKAKFKLLKTLVLTFFAAYFCLGLVCNSVEARRLVERQMAWEINFKKPGDKLIRNVKSSQDKKMPTLDNWRAYVSDNEEDDVLSYIAYNKNVSGLLFENIPSQAVLLVEQGATLLKEIDEVAFKNSCEGEFLYLYTAGSRIVVYIKQNDEYRYFDSHEIAEIAWVP